MTSINNNYTNIGHVIATKWNDKTPKGENNDCYWNIAQNSLNADANDEEIAKVMNELIELNTQKGSANPEITLEAGQKILMPIEQSIKKANSVIINATQNYNNAVNSYSSALSNLDIANQNVAIAKNALDNTKNQIDQNGNPIDAASLQQAYNEALNKQEESKTALQTAVENIKTQEENLQNLKNTLEDLQNEYSETKSITEEQNQQFQKTLDSINEQIEQKQTELSSLKEKEQEISNPTQTSIEQTTIKNTTTQEEISADSSDDNFQNSITNEKIQDYVKKLKGSKKDIKEVIENPDLTNNDWVRIINSYNIENGSLSNTIDSHFKGKSKDLIMDKITKNLADAAENNNEEAIVLLCQEIYNSTAGKLGTSNEFIKGVFENSSDKVIAQIMDSYNAVTGSEIQKDIQNDFSGKVEKAYIQKMNDAYQNTNQEDYTGWDDGKLSIQESAKSYIGGFFGELKNEVTGAVKGVVNTIKKHPIATAAAAAGTAAAVATGAVAAVVSLPAVAIGGGAVLAGLGIYQIGKATYNTLKHANEYRNAQTDSQAKESIGQIGQETLKGIEGVATVAAGVKLASSGIKALNTAETMASGADDAANTAGQAANSGNKGAKAMADEAENAANKAGAEAVGNGAKSASDIVNKAKESYSQAQELYNAFKANPSKKGKRELIKLIHQDNFDGLKSLDSELYDKLNKMCIDILNTQIP